MCYLLLRCHLGQVVKYDTVSKLGWSVTVRSHSIEVVINDILNKPWETTPEGAVIREVPPAQEEVDCIVRVFFVLFSNILVLMSYVMCIAGLFRLGIWSFQRTEEPGGGREGAREANMRHCGMNGV